MVHINSSDNKPSNREKTEEMARNTHPSQVREEKNNIQENKSKIPKEMTGASISEISDRYISATQLPPPPPLLSLPRELRDQCLLPLLLINNPHPGSPPPLQPPITKVSHQIRFETLQTFYGSNTFRFQLDFTTLLAKCRVWLARIGDENVQLLRKVELVGWRRIPFGHMFRRLKIVLLVDLRMGRVESKEEGRLEGEDFDRVLERVGEGWEKGWSVETLGGVMEAFWSGCADNF